MPKILITGNGFDLNFGLPTFYSDFIKILSHLEDKNIDFESIYSNSFNYSQIIENFNKFDFDYEKIELLKNSCKVFDDGNWIESKDQDPNGEIRLIQLADIGDGFFVDKSSRFIKLKAGSYR